MKRRWHIDYAGTLIHRECDHSRGDCRVYDDKWTTSHLPPQCFDDETQAWEYLLRHSEMMVVRLENELQTRRGYLSTAKANYANRSKAHKGKSGRAKW